ncbi:MAG: DNA primase [Planctomycetes bacterium]|nr:DNA primase [Planctomycetota bacterium]
MATRDEIERVRDATDLASLIGEFVALQHRGREHVGLCPFHDDSRPSFAVVTHKESAFYKCHACGAAGDCFRFVQEHLGKDFGESLRFLAERAGIELTRGHDPEQEQTASRKTWLRKALDAGHAHFQRQLAGDASGRDAREVIEARGISPAMVEAFGIGCAGDGWSTLRDELACEALPAKVLVAAGLLKQREDEHTWDAFRHRLMFPISDDTGRPIAFGGRILGEDEEPKYLNSSEHDLFHKSRTLYGLHLARRSIMAEGQAIVAEGYTDVIACHQAGFTNVVATLGTAMTEQHARHLSRLCKVAVLLFDGDEAGQRAAERAIPIVLAHDIDVLICVLPDNTDPDTLLRQPNGQSRFRQALDESVDAFEFLLRRLEVDLQSTSGLSARQKATEDFAQAVVRFGIHKAAPLRRAMVTSRLAELAGVAPAVIAELLAHKADRDPSGRTSNREESTELPGMESEVEVAPALRRAELDVLAVAIHSQHADISVLHSGLPLADPTARRIAQAIQETHRSGGELTMQTLLDSLPAEDDRKIASDLYFDGERLIEASEGDQDDAIAACCDALDRCRRALDSRQRMADWKASAARDPQAAAKVIEHLRGIGPRAAAMPRPSGQ